MSGMQLIETDETDGTPEITSAYGLYLTAPTQGRMNYLLQINGGGRPLATIGTDATVTLGEGATLDEASDAFWAAVEFHGKTLLQQLAERDAIIASLRGEGNKEEKFLVLRKEGGIQTYYKGWKMIVHAHDLEQAAKVEQEYRTRYPKTATAVVETRGVPFTTVVGEVDTGWTQVAYREVPGE